MRKFTGVMICTMVVAAALLTGGCKKELPKDELPSEYSPSSGNSGEGIYLGVIGFNDQLYVKDISLLNSSTYTSFCNFVNNLTSGNGTGLYYADYIALKKMRESSEPPKLKNVVLVTFTDGFHKTRQLTVTIPPRQVDWVISQRL